MDHVAPVTGGHTELVEQVRSHFASLASTELSSDDDIFALGLVNSLRALEIVVHIEQTYGITVEVEDLDLDNFRTAARTAVFVERKRSGSDDR